MPRPNSQDASDFYHKYINLAKGDSLSQVMNDFAAPLKEFYNSLPDEKAGYAYAPGKWTIKELLQHVIDTERIFTYRALCFARKDITHLPGFDENNYAANANANSRTIQSLKEEFNAVRNATDLLLNSFDDDQLNTTGTASNKSITVNAIVFIIYGHLLHHKKILEERYLP